MSEVTTAAIVDRILQREGGEYSDRRSDAGGPTRWGVTIPALWAFRGRPVTAEDIRALGRDEAAEVLEHLYVTRSGYGGLADGRVRELLCDWAVNSSVARATRWLQRTIGVTVDGVCGPVTVAAANAIDPRALLKRLGLARQVFYVRTALAEVPASTVAATDLDNLEGWLARNWALVVDNL